MLNAIVSDTSYKNKLKLDDGEQAYTDAIVRLILSSLDNVDKFLQGRKWGYHSPQKDKKGKLVRIEAYFL